MILALLLIPAAAGSITFFLAGAAWRRRLLLAAALLHSGLTAVAWRYLPVTATDGWLYLDAAGLLLLSVTSVLFLAAAVYTLGYLADEPAEGALDPEEGFLFFNAPDAVFIGCLLWFLAAMTLVAASRHFTVLWIGIEATTLASAPLIYFHRHHRSLEATWKYLLLCSVGIALALLGIFFLAVAAAGLGTGGDSLALDSLIRSARGLHPVWLKAAFVLILVGYGTKMGLAPMHTWLPDAHSEAPSVVSALLSGALLNCAFLGIFRMHQLMSAAGQEIFSQKALLGLGILSVGMAAAFILSQSDFKRLLAYSSVEHMGLLAVGLGLGQAGATGAFFHAVNHSLTKAMLFLVAGNLIRFFHTKSIAQVRGLIRARPWNGLLWLVGLLAITGTPPFGPFFSKFMILKAAFDQDRWLIGIALLAFLAVAFLGIMNAGLHMTQGPGERTPPPRAGWLTLAPPVALAIMALIAGLGLIAPLMRLIAEAAKMVGGIAP